MATDVSLSAPTERHADARERRGYRSRGLDMDHCYVWGPCPTGASIRRPQYPVTQLLALGRGRCR